MIEDLIKKDFEKVQSNSKVSEIIELIRKEEALAVFEDKEFLGIVSIGDVIERDYPSEAKINKMTRKNIPKIEKNKLEETEVAKMFLDSKFKAIPIFEKNKLEGLLYEKDLIKNSKDFLKKSDKEPKKIMKEPVLIKDSEKIGKARSLIKNEMISRIPVVDEDDKCVGILESVDFLKTINPKEGIGSEEIVSDEIPEKELLVTTIMNSQPVATEDTASWEKIIELMIKHDKTYVLFLEDDKPVGIITPKDILEIIVSSEEREGVYVQITGLDNIENFFDREKIDKMIEDFIQKIGKIYKEIEYMFVHIKSSQDTGGDKLYSIRTRILTPVGLYVSKSSEWNAIASVDEALGRLEKQIIKDHEKRKDSRISKS